MQKLQFTYSIINNPFGGNFDWSEGYASKDSITSKDNNASKDSGRPNKYMG